MQAGAGCQKDDHDSFVARDLDHVIRPKRSFEELPAKGVMQKGGEVHPALCCLANAAGCPGVRLEQSLRPVRQAASLDIEKARKAEFFDHGLLLGQRILDRG